VISYPLLRHPEVMKMEASPYADVGFAWCHKSPTPSAAVGSTYTSIGGRLRAGRDPQLTTSGNRHLGLPAAARPTHESHFETIHPDDREMIYRRLRSARKETGISRWNTACSNRAAASAGCSTAHA
jgi:hypothetical protein